MSVDVESEMALAVKAAGGEVVAELLPKDPGFKNADFLFRSEQVIAELKRFEHAALNDESFIEKGSSLFRHFQNKWSQEGRQDVPFAYGTVRITVGDFPEEFGFEYAGLVKDLFQSMLRKANRQVRETRKHFGLAPAKGLLLLCIDGNCGLTLEVVLHVIDRSLRGDHFTSINGVMICSANYGIALPGLPQIRPLLMASKDDRPSLDAEFNLRLVNAWKAQLARLGGPPVRVLGQGCPIEILRLRFQPITP